MQFFPQTLATSLVQTLSQAVLQQNGSPVQIEATQFACALSQPLTRAAPAVHSGCVHDSPVSRHVRLLQTVRISLTQMLSQAELQQNGSPVQIDDTQVSEPLGNAPPVEHLFTATGGDAMPFATTASVAVPVSKLLGTWK